jgi:hypothetical protein
VHGSPARVHLKKEKPKGIARNFLKTDSRGEDSQDTAQTPPGGTQNSAPTRRRDPGAEPGSKNFITTEQQRRQAFTEDSPAGLPTAEAGGTGRGPNHPPAQTTVVPSVGRAKAAAGKARTAGSVIDEAIDAGAADFNAQVKHRSKMIRDGRKRDNDRHR